MTMTGPVPSSCTSSKAQMTHIRDGRVIATAEGSYGLWWWHAWRVEPGDVVTVDGDKWTINEPGRVDGLDWFPAHRLGTDLGGFQTWPRYCSDADEERLWGPLRKKIAETFGQED